ncbi:MAG: hypothetical protein FWF18_04620 [Dehalococcoidia bacterium]|nr:hypothetical protein [Dehalococcoidia bacterium]
MTDSSSFINRREFLKRMGITMFCGGLAAQALLTGCKEPDTVASGEFSWPRTLHFTATGDSGNMKMLSWVSVMQASLPGTIIRVVNEPAWTNAYRAMAQATRSLCQVDKSTLRDCIEAINEHAAPDGGPWMAGLVWVDSMADTGFMVRGNSSIYKPEDIAPGTRIAIWNTQSATLKPFRSLLAWGGIDEKDIVWVNTGSYEKCPRDVADGRADLCMAAPLSPTVLEASSAPAGVRYVSLNPDENPDGAAAFIKISPLYNFGPIAVGPQNVRGTWGIKSYKYLGSNMREDEELVYHIAKWLDEHYADYRDSYESNDQMTREDLLNVLQTTYMPVHPGLARYLDDIGVWNADYEARNALNTELFRRYVDAYANAKNQAAAQKIEIKANNPAWIAFWENYKVEKQLPVLQMHVSLTQAADPVLPEG